MGIADREYVREQRGTYRPGGPVRGPRMWTATGIIVAINAAVFLIQALGILPTVNAGGARVDPLLYYGHFSTAEGFFYVQQTASGGSTIVLNLQVWRLITFQFLHANFMHVFFNMFGLWIFGGMVEQFLGRKRYVAFYLVCGIFGALFYVVLNLLGQTGLRAPGLLIHDPHVPLVGASAGVFGVIMASAYLAPRAMIMLLFPPIPLPLKVFAYGYVGISIVVLVTGGNNAGGEAAHIGGAMAGAFFIRNSYLLRDFFDVFGDSRDTGRRPRPLRRRDEAELDRILAKISREGMSSLTPKERRVLAKGSKGTPGG